MTWTTFNSRTTQKARKLGFRSGFEVRIASQLDKLKVNYQYEELKIKYVKPSKNTIYTPDFVLPNKIIIEAKGLFSTKDRQKHLLIQKQHPDLDIRFIFSNSKLKLNKRSKTTYGMWCETHGFLYADENVPKEWINAKK
jgi:hypothetical protein